MRVVQAYITSMVGSVDVVARDQSLDDPLDDGERTVSHQRGVTRDLISNWRFIDFRFSALEASSKDISSLLRPLLFYFSIRNTHTF